MSTTSPNFDDDREIIGTVGFEYPEEPSPQGRLTEVQRESLADTIADEVNHSRQETLSTLLAFLIRGKANAKQVGTRAVLLAYIAKKSDCRNQRELAKRLGVTQARVSQNLSSMKMEFASMFTEA